MPPLPEMIVLSSGELDEREGGGSKGSSCAEVGDYRSVVHPHQVGLSRRCGILRLPLRMDPGPSYNQPRFFPSTFGGTLVQEVCLGGSSGRKDVALEGVLVKGPRFGETSWRLAP